MDIPQKECGPGWNAIIDPLIKLCEAEGIRITQIKEKFGTLRFYTDAAPDNVIEAIDAAEQESAQTCELCGAPGTPRTGGWLKTQCDDCAAKP